MQCCQGRSSLTPILHPVAPSEAGFNPDGLTRVDQVLRSGLDVVFPAAVLLVARHGGVIFHRAYGYFDPVTRHRPTQTDSLFDLASLTKLFTVTAFMTLVEAGRVALDTPVADVLTDFDGTRAIGPTEDPLTKTLGPADPAFAGQKVNARQVTFWHLLTHTSGLAAWRSLYREGENECQERVPLPHQVLAEKRAQRVAAIHRLVNFAYPPGQRMVYSDLGIILLGEAIAHLAGVGLATCVRQAVLEPLNLERTTFNPLAGGGATRPTITLDQIVPTEFCAWRQRRCIGEVHDENAASLGGVAGHAGLFSTAWEVAVLGQTYLDGDSYDSTRILSPETIAEMTRVQVDFGDNPRGLGSLGFGLMAFLSGGVADQLSIRVPFLLSAFVLIIAFLLTLKVKEPLSSPKAKIAFRDWAALCRLALASAREATRTMADQLIALVRQSRQRATFGA